MLSNIRSWFYRFKGLQAPLEKYLFPMVLLFYPVIGVNAGLDITDVTYNMSNYRFPDDMDLMWKISTFLSNGFGSLIMKLPGAGTLMGFGVWCSLLLGALSVFVYYALQRFMPGWMIFLGLFMAESFCWCPSVILYNNLTYIFMTVGCILLIYGIFAWRRQNTLLFLAGVFLGLNVTVRFPNITEAALILVLWFYVAITRDSFKETIKKTLICIGGYLAGFGIPVLMISLKYGFGAYPGMIADLFGMTEGAKDYTAGGMITSVIEAYGTSLRHMLIMIPCVIAGVFMFLLLHDKYVLVKKLLYIAGLLILIKYYFSTGIFTRNYYYYDSIFQAAMMFIIITLVISVIASLGLLNGSRQEQTLGFLLIIIILITPLGSNNYTFPVINNLFLVAPIGLWLLRRLMQRLGDGHYNFPWQSMITMVIAVCLIQGLIFHCSFSFFDGADGTKRDTISNGIPNVEGQVTTAYNQETLMELQTALSGNDLLGKKVILFGGVPGLSYIFDMPPAIDTVWADLDSYKVSHFDEQLVKLSTSDEPEPVVIIGSDLRDYANISEKYDILLDYIAMHDYNKVFENERFAVYASNAESEE